MGNVAGSGGGNIFDKKASGKRYSRVPRGPVERVGPSLNPAHAAAVAAHALLHGTASPEERAAIKQRTLVGGTVFNPVTLGIDAVLHLPGQVSKAHDTAVRIAHPSTNPPSLGQNVEGLLGGAFGVPLMRLKKDGTPAPNVPRVPKGTATPETAGDLGQQVREGLRGAKQARTKQETLYSAERGRRSRAADRAMTNLGGRAGYEAALQELKGELPKLKFGGFDNFDESGLDALFTHIQGHPELRPFEKIRAQQALLHVTSGRVPTRSELELMGRVFGREVSGRIAASIPFWKKAKTLGLELMNVPRALMASMDMSAPFRQGLVAGARHPGMFVKNFAPMVKSFGSERVYQSLMDEIASRPSFPRMQEAGIALTDMGALDAREEQFMSNLAERIPIVGRGVRASGRAYTGFLNKMRADMFDFYMESAAKQGVELSPDGVKSVARFINSATGRGDLGMLREHAVTLNSLFFSPRLLFSRLNFLNPVYYVRLDPFARKQALRAASQLVGTVGATLFLAKLGGAEVNTDPRNADFAKIKLGNTRIDALGGFQQPVRVLAQLGSGKVISSTTGKTLTLGPQGPGNLSRRDIAQRFLEAKLAPTPSLVNDWFKGTDFAAQPFSWKKAAVQRMTPLLAQDAYELYKEEGSLPLALGGYAVGAFGIGIQTYGPKQPKASSSGGNIFTNPSGSGEAKNIFDK